MQFVGQRVVDGVDLVALKQAGIVVVHDRDVVLLGKGLGAAALAAGHGDELAALCFAQGGDEGAVGDAGGADDAPTDFVVAHGSSLLVWPQRSERTVQE